MLLLPVFVLSIVLNDFCVSERQIEAPVVYGGDRGIYTTEYSKYSADKMFVYNPATEEMLDDMIILRRDFYRVFYGITHMRNAANNPNALWPNKTLRYFMDREYSEADKKIIRRGTKLISDASCVRFMELDQPPSDNAAYVHINSLNGCFARVGGDCTKCIMSLSTSGCLRPGTVAHEFLHSLGFYHMQCSKGRDEYIDIIWSNMKDNVRRNFLELADHSSLLNTTYDYDSILHYGARFFSINGEPTIIPRDIRYLDRIGQREDLSQGDIERLNLLYQC